MSFSNSTRLPKTSACYTVNSLYFKNKVWTYLSDDHASTCYRGKQANDDSRDFGATHRQTSCNQLTCTFLRLTGLSQRRLENSIVSVGRAMMVTLVRRLSTGYDRRSSGRFWLLIKLLGLYELSVKTVALQEALVLPILNNFTILHNKNPISISDCGKTVRDDDGRPVRRHRRAFQVIENDCFTCCVL